MLTRYPRKPSFWELDAWPRAADVCIVGGGLVGLQTALFLSEQTPTRSICIVERSDPPAGASTRNAGFACVGSVGELADDIATIGLAATIELVERRFRGLALLRQRLGDNTLRYEACGNLEWYQTSEADRFAQALSLMPTLNAALEERMGLSEGPFVVEENFAETSGLAAVGAIRNRLEGQLHPGCMVEALYRQCAAAGIRVVRASVRAIAGQAGDYSLQLVDELPVKAQHVVVTTNGFARSVVTTPVEPVLNQVLVSAPVQGLRWTLPMHLERGYGYIRRIGNRVLVGGFRHRLSTEVSATQPEDSFRLEAELGELLRNQLRRVLPKGQKSELPHIEYEWSGVLGIGTDRDPRVWQTDEGVVVASGLGGMGVALGSLLAQEAAQTVLAGE